MVEADEIRFRHRGVWLAPLKSPKDIFKSAAAVAASVIAFIWLGTAAGIITAVAGLLAIIGWDVSVAWRAEKDRVRATLARRRKEELDRAWASALAPLQQHITEFNDLHERLATACSWYAGTYKLALAAVRIIPLIETQLANWRATIARSGVRISPDMIIEATRRPLVSGAVHAMGNNLLMNELAPPHQLPAAHEVEGYLERVLSTMQRRAEDPGPGYLAQVTEIETELGLKIAQLQSFETKHAPSELALKVATT